MPKGIYSYGAFFQIRNVSFHYLLFQSVWPFLINIHKKRPIFLALCLLFSPPFSSSSGLLLLWSGRILDTVFSGVDSTIGVE